MIRIPLPPATHSHSSDLTIPNVPASASHLPKHRPAACSLCTTPQNREKS
ncbi:hypothetical protein [Xylella fastidiosa]|nr:hypothetical protein [Xylella fastidiosa]UIX81816.1 hypothetical protein LZ756_02790 [Xylella fastidiosa subsp. sandyi]